MSYPFGRTDNISQPTQSQQSASSQLSQTPSLTQSSQTQPQIQTPIQSSSSSQQAPHTENPQVIETLNKLNYAQMSRLLDNKNYQRNVLAAARGNLLNQTAVKHVQQWIEAQQRKPASSSSPSPAGTPSATAASSSSAPTTKSPYQMLQLIREKMPTMQTYLARPDLSENQRTQVKLQIDQMLSKWLEITGQTFPNGTVQPIARPSSSASTFSGVANDSATVKSELADRFSSSSKEERRGIVAKRKIKEMLPEHDDAESDVEDLLADVTDDFIESVVHYACKLARHRKSERLEIKDVAIHLDRAWGIRVPGFSMDEIKQANSKRPPINLTSNYALNLQAVKEASKKRAL